MTAPFRYYIFLKFSILLTTVVSHAQDLYLKFDHLTVNNGLPQNSVYSIVKDKYGFMWFATWGGVARYDGYTIKVFRASENDTTSLPDNRINAIVTDSLQNIWVQTGEPHYLYQYSYEDEKFIRCPLAKAHPLVRNTLTKWEEDNYPQVHNTHYRWEANHGVLRQTHMSTGKTVHYHADAYRPFALSDAIINYMLLDEEDNIWIGTQNGGVNHANLSMKPFGYYNAEKGGSGLVENVVRAVCTDKNGAIWVGSENNGITRIERRSKEKRYTYLAQAQEHTNRIRSLLCDHQGVVWVGTKGGLLKFDPLLNVCTNCSSGLPNQEVFSIFEDSNHTLWIGTFDGLAQYNRATHRCEYRDIIGGKNIRSIIEDRHHSLWIATEDNGATRLQRENSPGGRGKYTSTVFNHVEGNENSLINNRSFSVAEDVSGMIWIATNSGLSRLNPANSTYKHFTSKNGLPDDLIMSVLSDGKQSVWVSHKKGLTRINIRTFEIQNFNLYDGLQGNEFSQNACFVDTNTGEMFFGGTNGLNTFYPDSIKINHIAPKIVLTNISVMNQPVYPGTKINDHLILKKSLLCTDTITLSWKERTLTLEFAALHYANPWANKYKYKLEGYDKQWVNTDASKRTASYAYIPPGMYQFIVYGANSDGIWSTHPAVLYIRIRSPWWLSWWAIIIYVAIACGVGGLVYTYLASKIALRRNEAIHRAKLQFFTGISHEFRTPLTLILDPLEKLVRNDIEKSTAQLYYAMMLRNAQQLLSLVNQLLDFRKLEEGHLNLNTQHADFVPFVRSLASAFETRAQEHHVAFSIKTGDAPLMMNFDPAKMAMVLNNLLSNAFKFTPKGGKVTVSLNRIETGKPKALLKVIDTGTGIASNELQKIFDIFYQSAQVATPYVGSGIGLALTKELVLLHGGSISVESEPGKGSCFTVELLLSADYTPPTRQEIPSSISFQPDAMLHHADTPLLLIVDDNQDIRHYLDEEFNEIYQVSMASNGYEGLELATEAIPDLIISDVMMPGMDGLEFCRRIKSDQRTSHIPVVLLTAKQSDEAKTDGFDTGADAYVTKPFSSQVLKAQVRNLLEQRQRLRELFSSGNKPELKKIAINTTDEAFLEKVAQLVEANMANEDFAIESLSEKMKMSHSQFYRKIKALTNQSLSEFINTLRMAKALEYLLSGAYNISETAYKVGFSVPNNFTRAFTKHYGASPSKYLESLKNKY